MVDPSTEWLEPAPPPDDEVMYVDVGGYEGPLDLLLDLCDQMEGRTVCALADAAAWPVRWGIRRFRDEFEARCKRGAFPGHGDGSASLTTSGLPVLPTVTPSGAPAA